MSGQPTVTRRSPSPPQPLRVLRLLLLLVPVGVLGVALKLLRVPDGQHLATTLTQISSDVLFGAGWTLAWLLIALRPRSRPARRIGVLLAHLSTLLVAVLTVVHHVFQQRTGSALTVARLQSTWQHREELTRLIGSQLDQSTVLLLVATVLHALVVPWLLGPPLLRVLRRLPLDLTGPRTARTGRRGPARRAATVLLAVGLLVSSVWTAPTASARFARAPLAHLVMAPVEERGAFSVDLGEEPPLPDPAATLLRDDAGPRRNVVVITLESQRSVSTLPPTDRPVTPFLDQLAARSIEAERAYPVVPHTSKSLTAIHCGVAPPLDSRNSEAGEGGIAGRCLPELLAEQGYRTAFFQSATEHFERRRDLTANLGFETFESSDTLPTEGFGRVNYFGFEDDVMLAPSREWLERQGDAPFMLSYLTVTAHHDYAMPEGYVEEAFVEDPELNSYLNGLHYQDRFVQKVVEQLSDLGLYEDTVVVVVGDHGEGFGEHGVRQHDDTIYEEGIRVPLIVHDPQLQDPLRITEPVQQTAILPTVAELLGFRLGGDAGRRSLLSEGPREPVTVTCAQRAQCMARLDGDLKYVHHFGDRRDEVFDVAADPYERQDLVTSADRAWLAEQREETLRWRLRVEREYRELRGAAGTADPDVP
ncbi:LTA synthase family protein [Auraticoccus monumenti]|uniref:Phosphoglycerol transferase MdoB n=1 Tax=Auraticoccus monumenti TaxID=675864 RepID=A0A1G7EAG0_9ACTN|nr:sulfatase-like hydrolase/transferase [Auraticoccus monumenti]SDE60446.1 Phosphoglycerol transferase MdoB [Auraticoccus monumenti]